MDWGLIGTIVFGIVAIILVVMRARRKKPVWAYNTTKIIGLGTNPPPELKLAFNGRPVNEVYRTTFILFNQGREAVRKEDVYKKATIRFKGAEILREPTIKATSKDAIKFSAKRVVKSGENSIELGFKYLDHEDGAVVEVIHTANEDVFCEADIVGAKEIVNIGEFETSHHRLLGIRAGIFTLIGIVIICLLVRELISGIQEPNTLRLTLVGVLIALTLSTIPEWKTYLHRRKFPSWSRNIPTPIEGTHIQAYCVKCRSKKEMKNPHVITLKNGRQAIQGVCPDCGTKMFRLKY
ncbi:hypothetical protein ES703_89016 [subsurface metagenome]